jgi:uncharacterized C2H2 Zn-finger protein
MFTCDNCSATFEAKKEYSQHSKKCLKEVETFFHKPTNQSITVKKNAEDSFECYCSDSGCPNERRVYKTIESLKRHLKNVNSHWVGPSKVKLADTYTKHITDTNEQAGLVDSHPARSIDASSAHQASEGISRRAY